MFSQFMQNFNRFKRKNFSTLRRILMLVAISSLFFEIVFSIPRYL